MTTISAKIVTHSISQEGVELKTVLMRYPRFIHAELMTHRVFSRNARSSRAVPVETMLREIETDPVVPLFWGKNQKGMQADEECTTRISFEQPNGDYHSMPKEEAWLQARTDAVKWARRYMDAGYHKQVINRILEPYMHIDVLVTSTEWANFLALRDHPAAEPHIAVLAREVKAAFASSTPTLLRKGQWHLPFFDPLRDVEALTRYIIRNAGDPFKGDPLKVAIALSVARCARLSYKPFDGNEDVQSEMTRYESLVGSAPLHASPAEHQATPDCKIRTRHSNEYQWAQPQLHGNLRGWCQYRKLLLGENINE